MPSSGNSLSSAMSSSGTGGLMPPSYQKRSNAPRSPLGANRMRTVEAAGKESSFLIRRQTWSETVQTWLGVDSTLIGESRSRSWESGQRL